MKNHFCFCLILVALASCVSHKKLLILQGKEKHFDSSSYSNSIGTYQIQPGDLLNIEISSSSSSQIEIFAQKFGESVRMQSNEASIFLNGYLVNNKGDIEMPLIGLISVQGLTLDEINKLIKVKLNEFINYVTVSTKLTNFKVTILGEVRNPGTFTVFNSNINLLQALGLAGDISELANKSRLKLIRKTEEGGVKTYWIDLASDKVIESDLFFLRPNDVIYVEPLKAKVLRVNSPVIQVTLSLVTLTLVVLNFFK